MRAIQTTARTVNRIVVRHHLHNNRIGGAVRTHVSGRKVHTFVMDDGRLHLISPRFSVIVENYYPGLGPSYVGPKPLHYTLYSV